MEEITFGQYAIPVVLTVVLSFLYRITKADGTALFSDRFKPMFAVLIGMAFGVLAMFYNAKDPNLKHIVDYVLYGFMTGAGSVGLWEVFSKSMEK